MTEKELEEDKKINYLVSKVLKENVKDMLDSVFKSKTFKTSMNYLKYIYSGDEKYLTLYQEEFNKLNLSEKMQVLLNIHAHLDNQKGKQKVKGKNG